MAKTQITDLILPEGWGEYVRKDSTEKTPLFTSGIVALDNTIQIGSGKTVTVPFLNDLTGDAEILSDSDPLTPAKVTAGSSIAHVNARGKAFSVNRLAQAIAGADVEGHVVARVTDYWTREFEKQALSEIEGVFGVAAMANSVLDMGNAVLDASGMIDAEYLLGDNRDGLTAVAMNSATRAKLEKLDLIDTVRPSDGVPFQTYRGKLILETDKIAATAGKHPIYFLGAGALRYAEGLGLEQAAVAVDQLANDVNIITRRSYVLHVDGFSFTGTAAGVSPTNTEFATAANWGLAVDRKLVKMACLKAKLA